MSEIELIIEICFFLIRISVKSPYKKGQKINLVSRLMVSDYDCNDIKVCIFPTENVGIGR